MDSNLKQTFVAIDPVSGKSYKRVSKKPYQFAVICHNSYDGSDSVGVGFNTRRELAEKEAMVCRTKYGWKDVYVVPCTVSN